MVKEKDNKDNKDKNEMPSIFHFIKKRWKGEYDDDEGVIDKIGQVINDYKGTKEKHEKNISTYESVSQSSYLSPEFFVLLIGSAFIAELGLLQNSVAVIIGAMLIAPMMMPILGFSLGAIWGDRRLLANSLLTLFVGTVVVLIFTALISATVPGVEMNDQMSARTHPNLYDILIGLASGLVGAYAFVNPRISSSVSGVAIAVALIPPLAVTGISLGQLDGPSALGSFLLYVSNLVSISLAASFVFWRMKVHPVTHEQEDVDSRAKRKLFLATIVLLIIAIPLGFFMKESFSLKSKEVQLRNFVESEVGKESIHKLKINKLVDKYEIICKFDTEVGYSKEKREKLIKKIEMIFDGQAIVKLTIIKALGS